MEADKQRKGRPRVHSDTKIQWDGLPLEDLIQAVRMRFRDFVFIGVKESPGGIEQTTVAWDREKSADAIDLLHYARDVVNRKMRDEVKGVVGNAQ